MVAYTEDDFMITLRLLIGKGTVLFTNLVRQSGHSEEMIESIVIDALERGYIRAIEWPRCYQLNSLGLMMLERYSMEKIIEHNNARERQESW